MNYLKRSIRPLKIRYIKTIASFYSKVKNNQLYLIYNKYAIRSNAPIIIMSIEGAAAIQVGGLKIDVGR